MEESKKREEGAAVKPHATGRRKPVKHRKPKLKKLPPFNVVLLDDDDHTVEYVVEMLRRLFGYPEEQGGGMVKMLDSAGRVIVYTTHKELAELKREQIIGYGADWRLQRSKGPMRAVVEPAPEG